MYLGCIYLALVSETYSLFTAYFSIRIDRVLCVFEKLSCYTWECRCRWWQMIPNKGAHWFGVGYICFEPWVLWETTADPINVSFWIWKSDLTHFKWVKVSNKIVWIGYVVSIACFWILNNLNLHHAKLIASQINYRLDIVNDFASYYMPDLLLLGM